MTYIKRLRNQNLNQKSRLYTSDTSSAILDLREQTFFIAVYKVRNNVAMQF